MRHVVIGVIYSIAITLTWRTAIVEASLEFIGKPEPNERRVACEVNEDLQSRIYPPEKYSDNAIKLALVLPVVKDIHIRIAQLSIEHISMRIHIYRKSDSIFNFKITGQGDAPTASLKVFIKDMRFATPSEKWAGLIAKGLAKVESFVTSFGQNIHTTQLKQVPVNIGLAMSADFAVGDDGAWTIVENSTTHGVDIDIGDRHPLMWLVNEIIDGVGGKDKIFFDKVWPLVKMLIHPDMGSAFQTVPVSAGEISMSVDISGHCVSPGKLGCDSDEVKLKVEVALDVNAELQHIVQRLAANSTSDTFVGSVYEHLAESYDKGLDITGSGFLDTEIALGPDKSIALSASPNVALQMPLVSSVMGSIEYFLPEVGDLTANVGRFRVEGGRILLDEVNLANLHLPINAEEAVSIDRIRLEDVVMEQELDESSDTEPEGIFSSQSPFSVASNSIYFKLGRENGLRVGPADHGCDKDARDPDCYVKGSGDSVVVAALAKDFVKNILDSVGHTLQTPLSARWGSKEEADGALPEEFQPPLPEKRAYLDVASLFTLVVGAIRVQIKQAQDKRTQLSVAFPFDADIELTPSVYRGIMESQTSDYGYVYLSVPVQSSRTRSLVALSCGSLKIYNAVDESDPFQKKPTYSVDLVDIVEKDFKNTVSVDASILKAFIVPEVVVSKENNFECCCHMEVFEECRAVDMTKRKLGGLEPASCGWMIGSGWSPANATKCHHLKCVRFGGSSEIAGKVVCGMPEQISSLQDGIVLQLQRFIDAARRGKPDATWFKEFDPYDTGTIFPSRDLSATPVISPHTAWYEASKPLLLELP